MDKLDSLRIGDLEMKIPLIQGGMGVKVSTASLAAAVANCGGAGVIASVGLGYGSPINESNYILASRTGLQNEICETKKLTDRVVGVNVMVALANYEDLVRTTVEEKADFIVSGAGLPLRLPEYTQGSSIKLIPIVSSAKAAAIIIKAWKKRYNLFPDAFVVEGPLAGGHLGFNSEELKLGKVPILEDLVTEVLGITEGYEKDFNIKIPVIAAGGIFTGKDIAKFFKLGVKGVQLGTRFVATFECSVDSKFKELYISAEDDDVVIIDSPVGMPGRAIKTKLIDRAMKGKSIPVRCNYRCLKTCDPSKVPYCIAKALFNAAAGDLDEAVVFCGSNVSKVKEIVTVKELIDSLVKETLEALD